MWTIYRLLHIITYMLSAWIICAMNEIVIGNDTDGSVS